MVRLEDTKDKYIKQHYVPEFLLNRFGRRTKKDKYKFRGFNLKTSQPVEGITEGFLVEKYFYDKTDPKVTELHLKEIDTKTSIILNKIIEQKSIQEIKKKELDKNFANSYYNISCGFSLKNEINPAIEYLQKAIEFNPEFKKTALKDSDFDNIRNSQEFKEIVEK